MAGHLDRLRRALTLIPLLQRRQGMRVAEIARFLGVAPREVTEEIRALVMMCGVPPYFPHNYINFFLEGDRVFVRFAEHFRRPVRLTLPEALALTMALRPLEGAGNAGAVFHPALAGLRKKIQDILDPEDARSLRDAERRIVAPRGPGAAAARRLQAIRDAMARKVPVRLEYFSSHRGRMSTREVHPYGVVEQGGDWYCIARDSLRGREVAFRVDRIRSVVALQGQYEVPEAFDAAAWQSRAEMFRPTGEERTVRVRYAPEAARWARENSEPREIEELPGGGVVRSFRTSSIEWMVVQALKDAPAAEVIDPPEVRAAVAETCAALLSPAGERGEVADGDAPAPGAATRPAGSRAARAGSRAPSGGPGRPARPSKGKGRRTGGGDRR